MFVIGILYFVAFHYLMPKLPLVDDSFSKKLDCTNCLLPMQYQSKKDEKFFWQCFKCGKQIIVSSKNFNDIEEHWSPPR